MLKLNYYFLCTIIFNYFIYIVKSSNYDDINYYDIKINYISKYNGLNCGQNKNTECKSLYDAYESFLKLKIIISPNNNIGVRFYFSPGIYNQTVERMTFNGIRLIQFIGSSEETDGKTIISGTIFPIVDLTETTLISGRKSVEFHSITFQKLENIQLIWVLSKCNIPISIIINQVTFDKSGGIINKFTNENVIESLSITKSKIMNSQFLRTMIELLNTTLHMDQVEFSNCIGVGRYGFIKLESGSLYMKDVKVSGGSLGTLISISNARPKFGIIYVPPIKSITINNLIISSNRFSTPSWESEKMVTVLDINDVESNGYINNIHFENNIFDLGYFYSYEDYSSMISIGKSNIDIIDGLTVIGNLRDSTGYNYNERDGIFAINVKNSVIGMLSNSSFDTVNVIMGSNSSIKIRSSNFIDDTKLTQCIGCIIDEDFISKPTSSKLSKQSIIVISVLVPVLSLISIITAVTIIILKKRRNQNKLSNIIPLSTNNERNIQTNNPDRNYLIKQKPKVYEDSQASDNKVSS